MTESHNWYSKIGSHDRRVVDAVAKWLSPVSWQWFVTLTFAWNVRGETADLKLKQWLNTLERDLKARVCFVAGKERKPESHGMEVPWHFHLLIASEVAIPQLLLVNHWRRLTGRAVRRSGDEGYVDDSVVVESYEDNRRGTQYCLKSMNSCDGDWLFRWLELFNPYIKRTGTPSHLTIRQRARFSSKRDAKN